MPVIAVEADLAQRMAYQLQVALGAIEALTNRRGDYLEFSGTAAESIKTVLDEFQVVSARPAVDKKMVNVIFGEVPDVGTTPEPFIFDTQAECDAFVRGVQEAIGNQDYTLCQREDMAVMADGEIRHVPEEVDAAGAVVIVHMLTADDCRKQIIFGSAAKGLVEIEESAWAPEEPALETAQVDIEIHHDRDDQDDAELTGDQWRDLESGGVLHDFLLLLAKRDPAGADELLKEVAPEGAKP